MFFFIVRFSLDQIFGPYEPFSHVDFKFYMSIYKRIHLSLKLDTIYRIKSYKQQPWADTGQIFLYKTICDFKFTIYLKTVYVRKSL